MTRQSPSRKTKDIKALEKQRKAEIEEKMDTLRKKQHAQNLTTIGMLQQENRDLKAEIAKLSDSLKGLSPDIAKLTTLHQHNRNLEAEIDRVTKDNVRLLQAKTAAEALNADMEESHIALGKRVDELTAKLNAQQAANRKNVEEVKALEAHNAALAKDLKQAQADNEALTTQAKNQRDAIEELEAKLTECDAAPIKPWDLQAAIAHGKAMEGEVARLNGIIEALKADVEAAKKSQPKPAELPPEPACPPPLGQISYTDEEAAHQQAVRARQIEGVRLMPTGDSPNASGQRGFGMILPLSDIYSRDATVVGTVHNQPVKLRAVLKDVTWPKRERTIEVTLQQIERAI